MAPGPPAQPPAEQPGGRPTPRVTTIEDVAKEAGVSVATVSRALRGLPHVAEKTRARVVDVAATLNYRRDLSAAALVTGETMVVAMAVPLLDSWYFSQAMAGAEATLATAGYDLLLASVGGDEQRHRLLHGTFTNRADGLILADVRVPDDEAEILARQHTRVVTVGIELAGTSSVMVDDRALAREAVNHLIDLGHHRIALIAGSSDESERFAVPGERQQGYGEALAAAGVEASPEYVVHGGFSVDGGRRAMTALLDLPEPPTAVFAMSDEMAFGALRELWHRGLDAPDDVSLIGVDDHELAEVVGLSTIGQQVAEHGAMAARLLLDELAGRTNGPSRHMAETVLIARRTTAAPARTA